MQELEQGDARRLYCRTCKSIYRSGFKSCPIDQGELELLLVDPMVGETLASHYVIGECVGEGAMGRVYLAHHARLTRRKFAIKILLGDLAADPTMRMRFGQEAEVASRLQHPNVVSVLDYGKTDAGLLYLVMDFVEGATLANRIERGALPESEVVTLCKDICLGLAHAHDQGLVHRDFKPENVVLVDLDNKVTPKVLDFGLAIISTSEESSVRLTSAGMVVGTPAYVSPEQARGLKVDLRTDLFALGVAMYEMLAGQLPFDGGVIEMLYANATQDAPPLAERAGVSVSPGMEAVVRKLMARDPDQRFRSAGEVFSALEEAQESAHKRRALALSSTIAPEYHDKIALESDRTESDPLTLPPIPFVESDKKKSAPRYALVAVLLLVAVGGVFAFTQLGGGRETGTVAQGLDQRENSLSSAYEVAVATTKNSEPNVVRGVDVAVAVEPAADDAMGSLSTDNLEKPTAINRDRVPVNDTTPNRGSKSEKDKPEKPKVARVDRVAPDRTVSPVKDEPAGVVPKAEPEPVKPEPVKLEPVKLEPVKLEPPKSELPKLEPPKPLTFDAATSLAAFSVNGSLSTNVVKRSVDKQVDRLRACYQETSRRAKATPRVSSQVHFEIDEGGRATSIRVTGSGLSGLDGCIADSVAKIRTRSAPDVGTVKVSFKVNYTPK